MRWLLLCLSRAMALLPVTAFAQSFTADVQKYIDYPGGTIAITDVTVIDGRGAAPKGSALGGQGLYLHQDVHARDARRHDGHGAGGDLGWGCGCGATGGVGAGVGKRADLALIDGDLGTDVKNIRKTMVVFKGGVGFDTQKILASVKGRVGLN